MSAQAFRRVKTRMRLTGRRFLKPKGNSATLLTLSARQVRTIAGAQSISEVAGPFGMFVAFTEAIATARG